MYVNDVNFSNIYISCKKDAVDKFYRYDSYLFRKLNCVLNYSMLEFLMLQAHGGGLMEYFGVRC